MRAGLHTLGRGLGFLIASLVAGLVVHGLWIDLVVLRPGCEPYSCGWPGRVTVDASWAVLAFAFVIGGTVVWLVGRRAPYLVATFTLGTVLWVAVLAFVGAGLDQHDKCSEQPGGGPDPECGTFGKLAWYFGDGYPVLAFCFLIAGAVSFQIRRRHQAANLSAVP